MDYTNMMWHGSSAARGLNKAARLGRSEEEKPTFSAPSKMTSTRSTGLSARNDSACSRPRRNQRSFEASDEVRPSAR
eukprot:s283_g3.t1